MSAADRRYVCIHGHFYQPPRENAWLEAIEHQESAHPYHDWNQRIDAECYAPNASSRILDAQDRIVQIVNNYERISFNFGPTLLSWLEHHDPETYAAILAADHASGVRFGGHGSALAQAYNHAILPLCNARDRHTQLVWGLADFRHRFRRDPEGLWLPETAVDLATLEELAAWGIKFTILAPAQATATRVPGSERWEDVSGERINPRRPYRLELPSGRSIALFFYDGPVSRAVAFERLLTRGEHLAQRLLGAFGSEDEPQLVHIATDGETYGHHHAFGDMALAYALHSIDGGAAARLTNYGEFLERHPPTREVRIREHSAWSCGHGVGRWTDDCGCNSGAHPAWHQRWRRPLREALDALRDAVAKRFEERAAALFTDPWAARDGYVELVLDRSAPARMRFFEAHARRILEPREVGHALELLEQQRHAMLMFTSCGWFFDELSGIETQQILQYAARVLQLDESLGAGGELAEPFLERLARAPSNLSDPGDGRRLFEQRIAASAVDAARVGANHAASMLFGGLAETRRAAAFEVRCAESWRLASNGARLLIARLDVRSTITLDSADLIVAFLYAGNHHLVGGAKAYPGEAAAAELRDELTEAFGRNDHELVAQHVERRFPGPGFTLRELFRDEQHAILGRILESTLAEVEATYRELYEHHAGLLHAIAALDTPQPLALRVAAEVVLNTGLRRALECPELDLAHVRKLLRDARAGGVKLDRPSLRFAARGAASRLLERLERAPEDESLLAACAEAVALVREIPFPVDLRDAENRCWRLLQTIHPGMRNRAGGGDDYARRWIERFGALAAALRVAVS